jgi:Lipid A 3-O-deacylase (PagL).
MAKRLLRTLKIITLSGLTLSFHANQIHAQEEMSNSSMNIEPDTTCFSKYYIHFFEIEARGGYIFPTNSFLKRENENHNYIRNTSSIHLKYAFKLRPGNCEERIYNGAYQGIGIARYDFGNKEELGSPTAFYLFQGARIAQLSSPLSVNYEWNFGISSGWHPYNFQYNHFNKIIGSEVNAYLNINFYLNWKLSHKLDLVSGITFSHFSNGNTKFPNAGLNSSDLKIGLIYNFNRNQNTQNIPTYANPIPQFPRHISYDLTMFGAWRRKGVYLGDSQIASPNAYTVLGFNFAPMYNLGYKYRVGASLDGVYDGSANVYTEDYIEGTSPEFFNPKFNRQIALGISARAEYVMPYFTVGAGIGTNMIHGRGDMKGTYQILALKIKMTRDTYLHIGYNLKDCKTPNYLMLGVGYRFNNKYPLLHR